MWAKKMTIDDLLVQLNQHGIMLSVEEGRLFADAKPGALTAELRAAVAARRGELIGRLSAAGPSVGPPSGATNRQNSTLKKGEATLIRAPRTMPAGSGALIGCEPDGRPRGRCPAHTDPAAWLDAAAVACRVRTTCRLCGAFIGYRPAPTFQLAETGEHEP